MVKFVSIQKEFKCRDTERILQASKSLKYSLSRLHQTTLLENEALKEEGNERMSEAGNEAMPYHQKEKGLISDHMLDILTDAAEICEDALIRGALLVLKDNKFTQNEIRTCLLIYLEGDWDTKTLAAFKILSYRDGKSDDQDILDRKGAYSLFRCILISICLCIEDNFSSHNKNNFIYQDDIQSSSKSESMEMISPNSKVKEESMNRVSPISMNSCDTNGHLAEGILSELKDLANFAADNLFENTKGKENTGAVSHKDFKEWYCNYGATILSWLELIDLKHWSIKSETSKRTPIKKEEDPGSTASSRAHDKSNSGSRPPAKKQRTIASSSIDVTPNFFMVENQSENDFSSMTKTLITFDFAGENIQEGTRYSDFCIDISEDNVRTFSDFVNRTKILSRNPSDITAILMKYSREESINGNKIYVIDHDSFGRCIREIVPVDAATTFSLSEKERFSIFFTNFFTCFERDEKYLSENTVKVKELAVGLSLLCQGKKSSKLCMGFELLDEGNKGFLTSEELKNYFRSYLAMLVGVSLLSETAAKFESLRDLKKSQMLSAVDNGAQWTVNQLLSDSYPHGKNDREKVTFKDFADWYTNKGFNIAYWLELLDITKLLSLLHDSDQAKINDIKEGKPSNHRNMGRIMSPRGKRADDYSLNNASDVLFTFSLGKDRSLVVLRDDASYVRSVVKKLGLVSLSPDDVWTNLYERIKLSLQPPSWNRREKLDKGKSVQVDQNTFVSCMEDVMALSGLKYSPQCAADTLRNFFQSFDLEQIDSVALNQLMGGLSLLCNGNKSSKLAFSFGLFDSRRESVLSTKHPSLDAADMFLFLRSILIIMFSCCRQSLELSAETVSRYIYDTSHQIADDVMRFQWHSRKKDRIDFQEFGVWYNEVGIVTAPWVELLDLKKWVLVDGDTSLDDSPHLLIVDSKLGNKSRTDTSEEYCPFQPPEEPFDESFFTHDDKGISLTESMDDFDFMLMQQYSSNKENDEYTLNASHNTSPKNGRISSHDTIHFYLKSQEDHGGYEISISQRKVLHLRTILVESGLYEVDAESAAQRIVSKAINDSRLTKEAFDSAITEVIVPHDKDLSVRHALSELLDLVFNSFDRHNTGYVDAHELAIGFTVLCRGKKSDKLESSFDLLSTKKDGRLNRRQVSRSLRSFLTVLLCVTTSSILKSDPSQDIVRLINGEECVMNSSTMNRAAHGAACWALSQVFNGCYAGRPDENYLDFDDFGAWYTRKGYNCISWLEWLDLRKWVIVD